MAHAPEPRFSSSPAALHIFAASILAYGWQVHGGSWGLGLAVLFYVLVPIGNLFALTVLKSVKATTNVRIALFVLLMLSIALSGAETCNADGVCGSLL